MMIFQSMSVANISRIFRGGFIVAGLVMIIGCDKKESGTGKTEVDAEGNPIPRVEDHDFAMTQEWVQTMLEENEENLSQMRSRLDSLRSEMDRLKAGSDQDANESDFKKMRGKLDEEEKKLRRLRENAESMHEVTQEEG